MTTRFAQSLAAIATLGIAAAVGFAQPANDDCAGATPVVDGLNNVDNTNATLSSTIPCLAALGGEVQSGMDVWYAYTASVTGVRNFEILNDANNPPVTTLAIYDSCGGTLIDCNVAGGVGGNAKIYHLPVTSGTTYLIRYSRYASGFAPNMLNISAPPAPIADDDCELATAFAGQGSIAFTTAGKTNSDLSALACDVLRFDGWIAWTPSQTGIGIVSACDATNVGNIRMGLQTVCGEAPRVCNSAAQDPSGPACGNARIVYNVVAGQTYYIRYGTNRVANTVSGNMLFEVRTPTVAISIPGDAIAEPGNCGDDPVLDLNGGCTVNPNTFTQIQLCETRQGTVSSRLLPARASSPSWFLTYDTDTYQFTLAQDDTITISGQTEFQAFVRLTVNCPEFEIARARAYSPTVNSVYDIGINSANTGPFSQFLVAGTYNLTISPTQNNGAGLMSADCTYGGNRYWFRIVGSNPCPTFCPADFNHQNGVSVQDIFDFLAAWFSSLPTADFNGANGVTVQDIFDFLAAFFTPCP